MDQKLLTDFRSELLDSRFGAKAISTIAESKRFPLHEMRDDVAFQIINDELYLDGNARQNLATFCQTWDDENVHIFRGLYARRDGDEMALAQAYGSRRQTHG
ncbi:MAG: hypothetical protein E6769_17190 [Escherichia coli]|nr:hypothetical protein [Escherichia coli]